MAVRYRLLCVGRIRETAIAALVDDFTQRLRRYHPVEIVEVRDAHGAAPARAMREESERLLRRIEASEQFWLLERTGMQLSSLELAERLGELERTGISGLTIAVAGPYGVSETLLRRADFTWSLSRLTLLHEWARALALEQLYRAAKILRGEPYHH